MSFLFEQQFDFLNKPRKYAAYRITACKKERPIQYFINDCKNNEQDDKNHNWSCNPPPKIMFLFLFHNHIAFLFKTFYLIYHLWSTYKTKNALGNPKAFFLHNVAKITLLLLQERS